MRRKEVYDDRRASRAVAVTTARRAAKQGALWGLLFGVMIAATEATYTTTFPTAASRAKLALSVQGNAGFEAVFGPIRRMDTVAGYTAYKVGITLIILAAIWGLVIATRVLRGEEDAGRWELLLSGQTTRGAAAVQAAIGLGAGVVALWVPMAVFAVAGGSSAKVGIGVGASLVFVDRDRGGGSDVHGDRHARLRALRHPTRREPAWVPASSRPPT